MAGKKKKRSVTGQLNLAARSLRSVLSQELSQIQLYPGQDAVLVAIGEEDGLSLRDLADRLAVRPPTVTKTVARLIGQGLVEKRSSPSDARQSHAFLTPDGHAIVDAVKAAQKGAERAALKGFSAKERKALRKLLFRVTANLDARSGKSEIAEPD
ncbi:MarR family winged helix-turn-helix transcriptional regulator [Aurantimonas sp. VKM B-3413]|uniref:MarR family winged helix-turn-helix transcriptional regulator n=1 Tax=Aurantimonas sp. VKM B-3413 TaxID=2779401 RepID=UPI001E5E7164|nr:MarR family transcriptional regulator [Aurantimonas sp. VKM B-3413]MCB8837069.1 MarR family transcriptional regulator [Aurantimonas sp. VKM B-3413]